MVVQDTSKEALRELKNTKIDGRRLQVYKAIKKMDSCSNSMIAQELKLSINKITGRVNELRNHFKVVGFDKKDLCPITKRMVIFWKVVRDLEKFEDRESNIFNDVVGKCYKCGYLNCECEVL